LLVCQQARCNAATWGLPDCRVVASGCGPTLKGRRSRKGS
jgi:hypothetical protein